ncbi:hypothetical protein MMPV_003992 [Pyropia vietnamensis]
MSPAAAGPGALDSRMNGQGGPGGRGAADGGAADPLVAIGGGGGGGGGGGVGGSGGGGDGGGVGGAGNSSPSLPLAGLGGGDAVGSGGHAVPTAGGGAAGGVAAYSTLQYSTSAERAPPSLAVMPGGLLRRSAPSRWRSGSAALGFSSRRGGGSNSLTLHGNGRVLAVVIAYGTSSLSGVFVNKACLSAFRFSYTIALLLSQLLVSVTALSLLRITGAVSIPHRNPRELLSLLLPTACFISNVCVGLLALRLVNIPMFSAFRRLSVLNVMALEWLVLGKTVSRRVMLTVVIMVAGSFLAGVGDLTYDPLGYALVFLNNFVTAANLVSIKKASQVVHLDALSLFYYMSLLALPVVALAAALTGELSASLEAVASRPELRTSAFAFALSLSAASAFLVNFFTNLCTQMTTPLTTAITGQMKNVLQTLLGIFAWGYQVSFINLTGLAVALFGSLLFAYYKFLEGSASGRHTASGGGAAGVGGGGAAAPALPTARSILSTTAAAASRTTMSEEDPVAAAAAAEYRRATRARAATPPEEAAAAAAVAVAAAADAAEAAAAADVADAADGAAAGVTPPRTPPPPGGASSVAGSPPPPAGLVTPPTARRAPGRAPRTPESGSTRGGAGGAAVGARASRRTARRGGGRRAVVRQAAAAAAVSAAAAAATASGGGGGGTRRSAAVVAATAALAQAAAVVRNGARSGADPEAALAALIAAAAASAVAAELDADARDADTAAAVAVAPSAAAPDSVAASVTAEHPWDALVGLPVVVLPPGVDLPPPGLEGVVLGVLGGGDAYRIRLLKWRVPPGGLPALVRVRVPHTPGDRVRMLTGPLAGAGGTLLRLRQGELAQVRLEGESDTRMVPLLGLGWVRPYAEEDFL